VIQRQWRWNRGGTPLGSRLSGKGTRPSYQNFSGNGIALAAMCAALHEYRPPAAKRGGFGGDLAVLSIDTFADSHVFLDVWVM